MFSIVIPLYNKAHTIQRTLTSVLQQTFKDYEVIIVNDGSTDNGVEIIQNFTSDARIKIFNQRNQGVSAARNNGVAYARFEYIAFLDGDDEWFPMYLEKMCHAITKYPESNMFCCGGLGMNLNGNFGGLRLPKKYLNQITQIDFFINPHVFLHTSATVVSKQAFKEARGFPIGMKRNEDFALFYSIALIEKVIYLGFCLTIYTSGVEGQATNISSELLISDISNRFNIVYRKWIDTKCKNKSFIIFNKYEYRHIILGLLMRKKYAALNSFISNLSTELKHSIPSFEIMLYKFKLLNKLAILYILITKFRWRLRRYPYVGEKQ